MEQAHAAVGDTARPGRKRAARTDTARIAQLRARGVNTSNKDAAARASPDRPLTAKMRDFVRHWAAGETILSASVRAGYADNGTYAYRLARDPAILRIYETEKRAYEEAADMTRKKVMEGLLEAIDMAKLVSEPASMVAGWREIAKMCGYYAPVERKLSIDVGASPLMERLNRLSDAELLKLIEVSDENVIEDVQFREIRDDADGVDTKAPKNKSGRPRKGTPSPTISGAVCRKTISPPYD